jgi:enoyl-CoA hydratase/carnithine racemase
MADAIAGIEAVTVACITGYTIGGGVVIATACDLRVMAADAWLAIPEIDIGIPFGWGGIPRLVQVVGLGTATELVLTGRRVTADEALRMGFANRVLESGDFDAGVEEIVRTLAAKPGSTLRADKQALRTAADEVVRATDRRSDAAMMLGVLGDDEARDAGRRYLERFIG